MNRDMVDELTFAEMASIEKMKRDRALNSPAYTDWASNYKVVEVSDA